MATAKTPVVKVHPHLNKIRAGKPAIAIKEGDNPMRYAAFVMLTNVTFKVSEAGRQNVLKHRRRVVHAWALGNLRYEEVDTPDYEFLGPTWMEIRYNPYHGPDFIANVSPGEWWPVKGAHALVMWSNRCYGASPQWK